MARRSRPTFKKRQKEMARKQRKQDKMTRRMEKKKERQQPRTPGLTGEDPDIAGIRPGPQPPRDDERILPDALQRDRRDARLDGPSVVHRPSPAGSRTD